MVDLSTGQMLGEAIVLRESVQDHFSVYEKPNDALYCPNLGGIDRMERRPGLDRAVFPN